MISRLCRCLLTFPVLLATFSPALADDAPPNLGVCAKAIQPFVDNHTIPGAVMLVADKDKVLDLEAVGYADLATQKPIETNDEFWIASMSKAFTATAIMMLSDEGKLSVNDPVEKYLPDFHGQVVIDPKDPTHTPHPADHPILIREILSHTSGLYQIAQDKTDEDRMPVKDYAALYAKEPLIYQPGTNYRYTNDGPNTAAAIVEVVSGMPFEQFLQDRIFTPLGMTNTTFWPSAEQLARLPKSYTPNPTTHELTEITKIPSLTYPLDDHTKRFPFPAGGLFSTADDIRKFCQMYLNDGMYEGKRYLSHEAIQALTTKETGDKVAATYGFCWKIADGMYGHNGADGTNMNIDPKIGVITVLMVQRTQKQPPELLENFRTAADSLVPNGSEGSKSVDTEGAAGVTPLNQ
jgi:CubicO group peptidase (beta-lactamase class C family)